jgi:trehalose 6-phosphate synthase
MSKDNIKPKNRLIIVSNRLPIVLKKRDDKKWAIAPGSGGLVTALAPVLRNRGGLWIGWPGVLKEKAVTDIKELLNNESENAGYTLKHVSLTEKEHKNFYYGFANEIIWPLFHDLQTRCNFTPEYWETYQEVNHKYAKVIAKNARKDDYIWVHDYHLMNVAKELRSMGTKNKIGFFLHIPFPALDIFIKLPWRFKILRALLEYDLIGFQTLRDRRNFVQCVRTLLKDVTIYGKGQVLRSRVDGREARIGAFPISIDFGEFARHASSQEVSDKAWYIHEEIPNRHLILGVDRLDYTKGIPYKLEAFRNALLRFPDMHHKVTLIQIVVPSREDIPEYYDLKVEIERLVGDINGQFTSSGWVPIHYMFRSLTRIELLAYYRTCETALVTPLKDGMNLVAKEYCASSADESGTLILSEFAGVAAQLQRNALLVNPYDIEGVAETIHTSFIMDREERRARMHRMRRSVRDHNIFRWVASFLKASIAKDLDYFPILEDYVPKVKEHIPKVKEHIPKVKEHTELR